MSWDRHWPEHYNTINLRFKKSCRMIYLLNVLNQFDLWWLFSHYSSFFLWLFHIFLFKCIFFLKKLKTSLEVKLLLKLIIQLSEKSQNTQHLYKKLLWKWCHWIQITKLMKNRRQEKRWLQEKVRDCQSINKEPAWTILGTW